MVIKECSGLLIDKPAKQNFESELTNESVSARDEANMKFSSMAASV
jgi:hypothetical protein